MAPSISEQFTSIRDSLPTEATMTVCQVVVDPWAFNLNALLVVIFGLTTLMMQIVTMPFRNALKT